MAIGGFGSKARMAAQAVQAGNMTQEQAAKLLDLRPGQALAPNGVIMGHHQDPGIPRFGADETDND